MTGLQIRHYSFLFLLLFVALYPPELCAEKPSLNVDAGVLLPDGDGDIIPNINFARDALKRGYPVHLLVNVKDSANSRSTLGIVARAVGDTSWKPNPNQVGTDHTYTVKSGRYAGLKIVLYDPDRETASKLPQADYGVVLSLAAPGGGFVSGRDRLPNVVVRSVRAVAAFVEPGSSGSPVMDSAAEFDRPFFYFRSGLTENGHYFFDTLPEKPKPVTDVVSALTSVDSKIKLPKRVTNENAMLFHSYFSNAETAKAYVEDISSVLAKATNLKGKELVILTNHDIVGVTLPENVHVIKYPRISFEQINEQYRATQVYSGGTGDSSAIQVIQSGTFPFLYEVRSHKDSFAAGFLSALVKEIDEVRRIRGAGPLGDVERETLKRALFFYESDEGRRTGKPQSEIHREALRTLVRDASLLADGRKAMKSLSEKKSFKLADTFHDKILPILDSFHSEHLKVAIHPFHRNSEIWKEVLSRALESEKSPIDVLQAFENEVLSSRDEKRVNELLPILAARKTGLGRILREYVKKRLKTAKSGSVTERVAVDVLVGENYFHENSEAYEALVKTDTEITKASVSRLLLAKKLKGVTSRDFQESLYRAIALSSQHFDQALREHNDIVEYLYWTRVKSRFLDEFSNGLISMFADRNSWEKFRAVQSELSGKGLKNEYIEDALKVFDRFQAERLRPLLVNDRVRNTLANELEDILKRPEAVTDIAERLQRIVSGDLGTRSEAEKLITALRPPCTGPLAMVQPRIKKTRP